MSIELGISHCSALVDLISTTVNHGNFGNRGGEVERVALITCPKVCELSKTLGDTSGNFTLTAGSLKERVSEPSVRNYLTKNCPPHDTPSK